MCGIKKEVMKTIISLLTGFILLTGFAGKRDEPIDGIWLGYYKSDLLKEKMVVKFGTEDQLEFYTGGINERSLCSGSYRMYGDSVSFKYTTADGEEYVMQGHLSRRKNYVEGYWHSNGIKKGSFFMEKQDVEEKVVQP
jgi:hypothetical protein